MDIIREENKFYIGNENEPLARLDYKIDDNILYINYVYVISHLRGQGIAGQLVNEAINFAKEQNLDIEPICSYARSYIFNGGK